MRRLARLFEEIWYSLRLGFCVHPSFGLVPATILFHLSNKKLSLGLRNRLVEARIRFSNLGFRNIVLRRFGGDLAIFFEVFLDECYGISNEHLDSMSVRTIVDCGSNIGLTALFFADRYPLATIYCIEPDPQNYEILLRNVEGIERIVPIQAALVGVDREFAYVAKSKFDWGSRVVTESTLGGVPAKTLTIMDICERYCLTGIDLLKIDIEGGEVEVFANANFLPKVRYGVIELHGEYNVRAFDADLREWGYVVYGHHMVVGNRLAAFGPQERSL